MSCPRSLLYSCQKSFHGHPNEWRGPKGILRRSVALYYYTADKEEGGRYDVHTDFQNVVSKQPPGKG